MQCPLVSLDNTMYLSQRPGRWYRILSISALGKSAQGRWLVADLRLFPFSHTDNAHLFRVFLIPVLILICNCFCSLLHGHSKLITARMNILL